MSETAKEDQMDKSAASELQNNRSALPAVEKDPVHKRYYTNIPFVLVIWLFTSISRNFECIGECVLASFLFLPPVT